MGEASADDGNYYFAYTPGKNNCAFENDGNLYIINALVGYDEGGSSVSLGWYQTVAFIWNVNYPISALPHSQNTPQQLPSE